MSRSAEQPGSTGDILLYEAAEGRLRLEVRLQDETLWLTQNKLAELLQTTQQNISGRTQNVYAEGELEREATHNKFLSVHQFLTMTGRELLTNAGSICNQQALNRAHQEFEKFREQRLQQPSEVEKNSSRQKRS